jgi:uncharacterized RDD family membrane protein YckC
MTLASRSTRLLGQFIDGLVGASVVIVGALISSFTSFGGGLVIMAGIFWLLFYYLFADGFGDGQSVAKRMLGMQVIVESTGKPCGLGKSFIRNILLTILGPIDWIFIFGEKRQRLGDMAAGTIVIAD